MRVRIFLPMIAALAALTPASQASSQTYTAYECTFVIRGMGGKQSNVTFATGTDGRAFALDREPGSDEVVTVPVSVRSAGANDSIFVHSFNVPNVDGDTARVRLQVRIPKAGGKSRVTATALGYLGSTTGSGVCNRKENMRLP